MSPEFVVIVCGGRDFTDWQRVYSVLDLIHSKRPITCLHHGAARGADSSAGLWAVERQVPVTAWPADWEHHGRAAGVKRNAEMLEGSGAHLLVAFPGGRGTADMVARTEKAGIKVLRVP